MPRVFDKNLFIMLLSIMAGAVIVTYFAADIVRQSQFDKERESYMEQIESVTTEKNIFENKSKNFTGFFLKSLGSLDLSREYRATADYYFDVSSKIWYPSKEYQKVIDNCSLAMENYLITYDNFLDTKTFFSDTKEYVYEENYLPIINLYVRLSDSGANISMLRYNASKYLKNIAENLSMLGDGANVSELMDLYNETNALYDAALDLYNELKEEIESEYGNLFNPNRETP